MGSVPIQVKHYAMNTIIRSVRVSLSKINYVSILGKCDCLSKLWILIKFLLYSLPQISSVKQRLRGVLPSE